jgi:hypothetical protein
MFLDRVPERWFETAGTVIGCTAWVFIIMQIAEEWAVKQASTLSIPYICGFGFLFLFWTLYGIRFRRIALWFGNLIALLLQAVLLAVVLMK